MGTSVYQCDYRTYRQWKIDVCPMIRSQYQTIMGIETYGSMVKQILNDVHDADVSVVTLFRKQ
jgi:hypothetical protein